MPVFDTHKAVKALRQAGFDVARAEAVVEQINQAVSENVTAKTESGRFDTEEDLERLTIEEALKEFELRFNTRLDRLFETLRWDLLGIAISFVALTKVADVIIG